jgi:hypothetical protein
MFLTAALIAVGTLAIVLSAVSSTSTSIANRRSQIDALVLATAKEALIGYAASQSTQPGVLPCPDTDNDGSADAPCAATGVTALGRLPWKTLGLPDLRDGAGECLWYAVSSNFKNSGVSGPAVVNSDSAGTLFVNDGAGNPLPSPSSPAAAIVFAPGKALAGQARTPPLGPATICGGNNVAANYLEGNNAVAGTAYLFPNSSETANDRLQLVSTTDVMTVVEQRAAREILQLLAAYRSGSSCNCYPWADSNFNGSSNSGTRYGGIPLLTASPESWSSAAGTNPAGTWLGTNQWFRTIYYAVSQRDADGGSAGDPRFTVDTTTNVRVVILSTGPALAGDGRPSINWANYVEDAENRDNNNTFCRPGPSAVAPCTPTSTYGRDRLYTIQ